MIEERATEGRAVVPSDQVEPRRNLLHRERSSGSTERHVVTQIVKDDDPAQGGGVVDREPRLSAGRREAGREIAIEDGLTQVDATRRDGGRAVVERPLDAQRDRRTARSADAVARVDEHLGGRPVQHVVDHDVVDDHAGQSFREGVSEPRRRDLLDGRRHPGHHRCSRKNDRTSSTKRSGTCMAAKCPPRGISRTCTRLNRSRAHATGMR